MNNPVATYRFQFHKEFTFSDLEKLIPYLTKLGVSTVYASPVFKSTPGSTHGYDGVSPNEINPEIGSLDDLKRISKALKESRMSWIQDIVPNHMAFHPENPWLMDVLEKGSQSVYSGFFDMVRNSRLFHGKLMVPFLGADLGEEIEAGKVKISYASGRFGLSYEGALYPLSCRSYSTLFESGLIHDNQALAQLAAQCSDINSIEDPMVFSQRWNELLLQLSALMANDREAGLIKAMLDKVNADISKLKQIVDQQTYVLSNWEETDQQINFRRFFTVNGLICLNIQKEEVFSAYHALIKELVDADVFQGLRIDHIDGLYDPSRYLEDIRKLAGENTYIVVEKILGPDEDMPDQWPIEGTTGYEFLATVNNLFTNQAAESKFTGFYQELTGESTPVQDHLHRKKSHILFEHMGGELENLCQLFVELNLVGHQDLERVGNENIKKAIGEFLIHCPVYRYYGNRMPLEEQEMDALQKIFDDVKMHHPDLAEAAGLLEGAWIFRREDRDEEYQARALEFYQRCMQFTGPLMAKGGEDTLMYTYERFIGHNDVGDSVEMFGIGAKDFHRKMKKRRAEWPLSLNTTSTHDTKRGEDVRARLNVLTDLVDDWITHVKHWQALNAPLREQFSALDVNDEYLIYQTLVGAYPVPGEDEDDFDTRLCEYLQKALREAKTKTTWAQPNEEYETGTRRFAQSLLEKEGPFWKDFTSFQKLIADYGIINSLAQLILKFTCPGVPDVYQGCELWDLSLVDPDNRREVDFEKRQKWLEDLEAADQEQLPVKLWSNRNNAQIKLWMTKQLFGLRRHDPTLFSEGDYVPLQIKGKFKDHLFAFARTHKQDVLVIVVPLHLAALCKQQGTDWAHLDWKDTKVMLPAGVTAEWSDVLTGQKVELEGKIVTADQFSAMPFAIVMGQKAENERSAGILMHISSLASPFGIGDMGGEAFAFADFLERSHQKIWQLLPLNPTEASQGHSPYSALSSRAGNPLLISPELLQKEGLLEGVNLEDYQVAQDGNTAFERAGKIKNELLEKAFATFSSDPGAFSADEFDRFCRKEEEWLEDFAVYMVLRDKYDAKPWIEWDEPLRLRDPQALKDVVAGESTKIRFIKWVQFIFYKQWISLRAYCNEKNIKLLGDMPFYVSYNSADVWSHRDLFLLDQDGKITGAAGVPPDAFSDTGQLWGMPVFNWLNLKEQRYGWWIERLRKNTEMFDLTRLDHFRAFADYWLVPGDEETAVKGEWKTGPGSEFFTIVQTSLGGLPFVAEDLGEISPAVFALRDEFNLPGMKVLQFAFDESMAESTYIPHNYTPNFIAYTGTHDNNTIKGWFKNEVDEEMCERIEEYLGRSVDEDNVYSVMARLAYSSVAKAAVIPIQDLLNLDETCRMNSPGSGEDNWRWRLLPGQLTDEALNQLKSWTKTYRRG